MPRNLSNLVFALTFVGMWFSGSVMAVDTMWQSTNPGAGGAFGAVGAGPTGVIIVGGDLAGAYRSLDRGQTWDLIGSYRGLTSTHICGLGFDPTNASVIFIGSEHGLFRSADTGSTFNNVINGGYITDIMVAPSDSSVAYAAYHSKYNLSDGKVYKSTDNGLTWMKISVDLPNGLHILKLLVKPDNPDTLYLLSGITAYASGPQAVYRSNDGGIHWMQIGASLGEVKDIQMDKSNFSTLYLSTYLVEPDKHGFLYRSEDDGNNWTELVHRTGFIWQDSEDPQLIKLIELGYQYPGGSRSGVWAYSDSGDTDTLYRFSDIGEEWERGWSQIFHYGRTFNGDAKTFGEDMSDPDALFWITYQWVYGSFDGGHTFQNLFTNEITPDRWQSRGINNAVLFDIEISPANSEIIYLGYFDLGFFRSLDYGISWENCNHPAYTGAWKGNGGSTYTIAADPTRSNVVWAAQSEDRSSNKVLLRSTDSGAVESWERVGSGLPSTSSLFGLSVDQNSPESSRTLFITAERNVYVSNDDAYNWSQALDCNGNCHFTAIDHFNGNLVYAGGSGGVWRSVSGGASGTWEPVGLPEMKGNKTGDFWEWGWVGVMDIETDPFNPGWVYVAVFGNNKGLYRSKNHGDTWEKLLTDKFMRGVAVSPANSQIIYAASSQPLNAGGYSGESKGVLKSMDGGQTWIQFNEGLSWPFASAIEIDPISPDIVMIASPGEGFNYRNFVINGPVRFNLQPGGTLAAGTNSTTISLNTTEAAICKYSAAPNTEFSEMQNLFSTTEGKNHSSVVSGLSDNHTYNFYCRCQDEAGNTNPDDFRLSFSVGDQFLNLPVLPVPEEFTVQANNLPFGGVNFSVILPGPGDFMLRVYDIAGRQVWSYKQANANTGVHNINWNGVNNKNKSQDGVYCVVLSSAKESKVTSLLFIL
ncbi:hypothetical protein ACFLTU_07305 [Bacteroidota bacterium]